MRNTGRHNQDPSFNDRNRWDALCAQVENFLRRTAVRQEATRVGQVESVAEITLSTGEIIGRNEKGYIALMGTRVDGHPDDGGTLREKRDIIPFPHPDDDTVIIEPDLPENAVRCLQRFSSVFQLVNGGGGNITITPDQITEVYQINPTDLLPDIPSETA